MTHDSQHEPKADYRALSSFFRGYLHQDAAVEYGSATAAAKAFRRDADEREASVVRAQLERLLGDAGELPDSELACMLENLGCAWRFKNREELSELLHALL